LPRFTNALNNHLPITNTSQGVTIQLKIMVLGSNASH
jgi:hypothetical protein